MDTLVVDRLSDALLVTLWVAAAMQVNGDHAVLEEEAYTASGRLLEAGWSYLLDRDPDYLTDEA